MNTSVLAEPFPPGDESAKETLRECISMQKHAACYRQIGKIQKLPEKIQVDIAIMRFIVKSSLRKCPESKKNQERVFVPGDAIEVITNNIDLNTFDQEIWFFVIKPKKNTQKLWKRSWTEIRKHLSFNGFSSAVRKVDVLETGITFEEARIKHFNGGRNVLCYKVSLYDTVKPIWFETDVLKKPIGNLLAPLILDNDDSKSVMNSCLEKSVESEKIPQDLPQFESQKEKPKPQYIYPSASSQLLLASRSQQGLYRPNVLQTSEMLGTMPLSSLSSSTTTTTTTLPTPSFFSSTLPPPPPLQPSTTFGNSVSLNSILKDNIQIGQLEPVSDHLKLKKEDELKKIVNNNNKSLIEESIAKLIKENRDKLKEGWTVPSQPQKMLPPIALGAPSASPTDFITIARFPEIKNTYFSRSIFSCDSFQLQRGLPQLSAQKVLSSPPSLSLLPLGRSTMKTSISAQEVLGGSLQNQNASTSSPFSKEINKEPRNLNQLSSSSDPSPALLSKGLSSSPPMSFSSIPQTVLGTPSTTNQLKRIDGADNISVITVNNNNCNNNIPAIINNNNNSDDNSNLLNIF